MQGRNQPDRSGNRFRSRLAKLIAGGAMACLLAVASPLAGHGDAFAEGPAVSGFNSKFSGEGGVYDDEDAGLAQGSIAAPLGHGLGFQADGIVGGIDGETLGGGGAHLFARDPSSYLLGAYGSYHSWDSIEIWRLAGEAELYLGRMTLGGIAGWEDVNVPGTKNGLRVVNRDDGHFFTELDLSYYPADNLKLSVGYNYEDEASLGAAGFEYMPRWSGLPISIFGSGNFGDSDHTRVTGGLKAYFAADRNKSLIRRHREDDPRSYNPVFPNIRTAAQAQPQGEETNFCPTTEIFPTADHLGCTCPPGTARAGEPPNEAGGGFSTCTNK